MSKLSKFLVKPKKIDLPNADVAFIRKIGANERIQWFMYSDELMQAAEASGARVDQLSFGIREAAKLLSMSISDENGKRIFTDEESKDIEGLPPEMIDLLFEETLKFNNLLQKKSDNEATEKTEELTAEEKSKKK